MKAAGFWETLTVTALASPPVKVTVVSRGALPVKASALMEYFI